MVLSSGFSSAGQFGPFTYADEGTTITITAYPAPGSGHVEIPESIDGKPVTRIGPNAFSNCKGIVDVTIPTTVTDIGASAFYDCGGLTDLTIPHSVASIGSSAFVRCVGLTQVTIPSSVTEIGSEAFQSCPGLTSISIPSSVVSIGGYAFLSCRNLKSIEVDAANPSFSSSGGILFDKDQSTLICCPGAYQGAVSVSSTVTNISPRAFSECASLSAIHVDSGNPSYCSVDGVLLNKSQTTLIQCPEFYSGSFVIPATVTDIESGAFQKCQGLTDVSIPDSVTSIGPMAFRNCSSLVHVKLPASLERIEISTFLSCVRLASVELPSSLTYIGSTAFRECISLSSISIPASAVSISSSAFSVCTSLAFIDVEAANANFSSQGGVLFDKTKSTLHLYPSAASGEYSIPSSVTSVAASAFRYSSGLTRVTIPDTVINIGSHAFAE
ncbi:MAG: leucine-rich repeat domain-containing protein, partial [Planctomycetaceae bacterium]|nr:leucine-rich repeat domain-containing protein [Planctomycetaceae bacterium]